MVTAARGPPRRALVRKLSSRASVFCPCLCPFPLGSVLSSLTVWLWETNALTLLCILLTEKLWFELDYEPGRQPAPRQEGAGIRISRGCTPSAHTPGARRTCPSAREGGEKASVRAGQAIRKGFLDEGTVIWDQNPVVRITGNCTSCREELPRVS